MKKMFQNSELQSKFEQDGYVVVPFLDKDALLKVLDFYETVRQEHEITSSVHSTSDTNNESLIRLVDNKLKLIANFAKVSEAYILKFYLLEGHERC